MMQKCKFSDEFLKYLIFLCRSKRLLNPKEYLDEETDQFPPLIVFFFFF